MRIIIDTRLLAELAGPLRDATDAVCDVQSGTRDLTGLADETGHAELGRAIDEFLGSWEQSLGAVAQHGETLSRMLHLATAEAEDAPSTGSPS